MARKKPQDPQQGRANFHGKFPAIVLKNEPVEGQLPGVILVEIQSFHEDDPASPAGQRKLRKMQRLAWPCLPPGSFIVPDVNTPVWIEFVAADPRYVMWSGAFFAEKDAPKNDIDEAPTQHQRLIRSVLGNVLLLDDTPDEGKLVLREPNKNTLTMNKDGIVLANDTAKITLNRYGITLDFAGHTLTLEKDGIKIGGQAIMLEPLLGWLTSHAHTEKAVAGLTDPDPISVGKLKTDKGSLTSVP